MATLSTWPQGEASCPGLISFVEQYQLHAAAATAELGHWPELIAGFICVPTCCTLQEDSSCLQFMLCHRLLCSAVPWPAVPCCAVLCCAQV
jgi:hypothetical protein